MAIAAQIAAIAITESYQQDNPGPGKGYPHTNCNTQMAIIGSL